MATIIAVANQKGGVGKTTTVVNIAAYATLAGRSTLVIDLDPQGNATSVLCSESNAPAASIFSGGRKAASSQAGLSIIAAGHDILDQERRLLRDASGRLALKSHLRQTAAQFDIVFIDCPPSLAILPTNALLSADMVLIPIQCEYYAMEGLSQILNFLLTLEQDGFKPTRRFTILLTMFDASIPLSRQVAGEIRQHFPQHVLSTPIPRDVALAAAPSHGRTILAHDPLSPGGLAYLAATKELLDGIE